MDYLFLKPTFQVMVKLFYMRHVFRKKSKCFSGYVDPAISGTDFIGNLFFFYKDSIDQSEDDKIITD